MEISVKVTVSLITGMVVFGNFIHGQTSDSDFFHSNDTDNKFLDLEIIPRNVKFYCCNRLLSDCLRLRKTRESIRKCKYESSKQTKIIIHGYSHDHSSDSVQMLKNAYLMETQNRNLILVDWSEYSFPYLIAYKSASKVGDAIAEMVMYLKSESALNVSDVHVIGHSLGAHIAGFSGSSLGRKFRLGRITGLDPAAPGFRDVSSDSRLGSEDAEFVDVIHTSIRLLGLVENIGHVDFYPNGGMHQPRCPARVTEEVIGLCDHSESYVYYAESILNGKSHRGRSCNVLEDALEHRCQGKVAYMGENSYLRSSHGIYYVDVDYLKPRLIQYEVYHR